MNTLGEFTVAPLTSENDIAALVYLVLGCEMSVSG
jgi:hypothetical protein